MSSPLDKLKKIRGRSWDELRERGGQAFSVYGEQFGFGSKLPTADEIRALIKTDPKSPNLSLRAQFALNADHSFFQSFVDFSVTAGQISPLYGDATVKQIIAKADKIVLGRFDLLGFLNLSFGEMPDWHLDPISGRRSPLKHWKQFDELDTVESGDKKIVWELNRHQYFVDLGLAFHLTRNQVYADTFAAHIMDWMENNPPGTGVNWISSLEVGFRAISWIWAFNLFRGNTAVTEELFTNALRFLYAHGRHIERYISTYYSPNTHLTGEALALYYLGTQLSFLERSDEWRNRGEQILTEEINKQILPDGVYFEQTTWYQRYTADFYLHFLILKTLSHNTKQSALTSEMVARLQSCFEFLMYAARPDGTTPLIGDDDGGFLLPRGIGRATDFRDSLAVAATIFDRPDFKFAADVNTAKLLFLLGTEGLQQYAEIEAQKPDASSRAFIEGGYYVMRDGWDATDNYVIFDCGDVGSLSGGHGHADSLSFELALGGKPVIVDSGTYTYHESAAMRDHFRSSAAHNTLMIDDKPSSEPGNKFTWGAKAVAVPTKWISQERFDFFEGSHDGYRRLAYGPATHSRSCVFLKNDYVIIRDFVETNAAHDYQLNFHFAPDAKPTLVETENKITCVQQFPDSISDGWRLFTFGDNGNWQQKETWISENFGSKINAPLVRFASNGIGPQEFFTFILPACDGAEMPFVYESAMDGGRAFVVSYRNYWDLLVFADDSSGVHTEFFDSNFQFTWARMFKGEESPEEFVLIGGSRFSLGSREVVNYPGTLDYATARRLGNRLNVRTSEGIFSVSLPQVNSSSYILKRTPQ